MQTVVETPTYLIDAARLPSLGEPKAIVGRIAADPYRGVVIPRRCGIQKVRLAFDGRGKSGKARVVYLF